ncbi:MAG: hypothetical protein R3185_03305 [Candidatus Thermoplasmatota archaeon]|nr:hypothetical protein [Candidatus Thermoplasmatota archaeon]
MTTDDAPHGSHDDYDHILDQPTWVRSGLVWSIVAMFSFLAFLLTCIHAMATGEVLPFYVAAGIALVFAVLVVPAWALKYLGLVHPEYEP